MTSVEKVYVTKKAVLWQKTGIDQYNQVTVGSATEIVVEWPQGFIRSNSPENTEETRSDEIVANQDIPIGSLLWLGAKRDLPDDLSTLTDVRQVTSRTITPDIKNRANRYSFALMYYSNTFPS